MAIRDLTVSELDRLAAAGEAEAAFTMTEEAFRAFYDRTARSVWGYLTRLTGDASLADDLLQEAYYRFLRAGGTHESEAHRRNTLFKIATNLARDTHRRKRVLPFFVHEPVDVPSRRDAEREFEHATDLDRAMSALKPRDRAMLWLAYAEGSSHQEIAGVMGVKTGSVKLLLFRARRRLAALLGRPIAAKGGA
jgi:RNA polymerase sigma-70 factor (ECF subfamily)